MRINKFVAAATGISRRSADQAIQQGRVLINGVVAELGSKTSLVDNVTLDDKPLSVPGQTTIMLNKPAGYVCSRNGQGNRTIYDLLPAQYRTLKPIGRLDKDSSGLILLTNDGQLAQELTHPSKQKNKVYEVMLDKPLAEADWTRLTEGVQLEDGLSKFEEVRWLEKNDRYKWMIVMREGRNRQIRRTFAALGYTVASLHRTQFGPYSLGQLKEGKIKVVV